LAANDNKLSPSHVEILELMAEHPDIFSKPNAAGRMRMRSERSVANFLWWMRFELASRAAETRAARESIKVIE